jgi:hypothetical protein
MSPKKKKPAHKSTSEELAHRAFGKKLHEHLKNIAHSAKPKRSE